jgi:SAM-dependent methyltransferase
MDNWDFMNEWHLVLPPSRPSAYQLELTRKLISNIKRDVPVAILGSTPEFRDFVFEEGFHRIFVIDKNSDFHDTMTNACIYHQDEIFVHGDWLDVLDDYKNTFGLVLSDLTMGNVAYSDRECFYQLISDSLSNGGLFIDKVLTHPIPHIKLNDIFSRYSRLPLNWLYINYFSCEALFCSELLYLTETVDTYKFYDILTSTAKNDRIKAFILKAHSITPENCIWYYGRNWETLKRDYCPGLKLAGSFDDELGSPYYRRLKYYSSEKL